MESGQRKDKEGKVIPRMIINKFQSPEHLSLPGPMTKVL